MTELSVAALIPTIVMCVYIYAKDHKEKESPVLLGALLGAGALVFLLSSFVQDKLFLVIDRVFSSQFTATLSGSHNFTSPVAEGLYSFSSAFLAVALIAEICKWAVMFLITKNNKNFNCLFDGIVYATFVSFGFAALENIYYATQGGWDTLILRTAVTLPMHLLYGVIMGFFYTVWNSYRIARLTEKKLQSKGLISVKKKFNSAIWLSMSIVLPVIIHGFYELSVMRMRNTGLVFFIIIVAVYIFCFASIHKISKQDNESDIFAIRLLTKKYATLKGKEDELNTLIDTEVDPR